MNNSNPIKYELTTSKCKTDGVVGEPVYGVKALLSVNEHNNIVEYKDVSCKKDIVEYFISLINRCEVSLEHLYDVVEDYIAEK